MQLKGQQSGALLLDVLLVLALLMILSTHAVPQAAKFYRQAVVEYEAEQLLATLRYCQNTSRITADSAWGYGAKEPIKRYIYLQLFTNGNQLLAGEWDIIANHQYLPGVKVAKVYQEQGKNYYDDSIRLYFGANGRPGITGMMTLCIYYQGYPAEGKKIMISEGGRIRMERGTGAGK